MIEGVTNNHLFYQLNINYNSPPPPASTSPAFTRQNTFEKKLAGEMLTEQIIEFELRGPGPPCRTCTPTTGYFRDKTKIS